MKLDIQITSVVHFLNFFSRLHFINYCSHSRAKKKKAPKFSKKTLSLPEKGESHLDETKILSGALQTLHKVIQHLLIFLILFIRSNFFSSTGSHSLSQTLVLHIRHYTHIALPTDRQSHFSRVSDPLGENGKF